MQCRYCDRKCKSKQSLSNHEIRCKLNPNRITPPPKSEAWLNAMKRRRGRGTNQYTKAKELGVEYVVSDETREKLRKSALKHNATYWTPENRDKHSEVMKQAVLNNPDSYSASNVSGRVKMYEYEGFQLKGTWELVVAKSLVECNIEFSNDIKPIPYEYNGKEHLYFPDFYLPEYDLYIEVKGYERDRDICKWKVVDNLIVLRDCDIKSLKNGVKISHLLSKE